MPSLREAGLLLNLSISAWTGYKTDRALTEEVKTAHRITSSDDAYKKALVPLDALKPIRESISRIRTFVTRKTLPWQDGGTRILPSAAYLDFAAEFAGLKDQFDAAVTCFLTQYPALVTAAETVRGSSFLLSDYPPAETMAENFAITMTLHPIADSQDFRVDLPDETIKELQIEAQKADTKLYQRIRENLITQIRERLEMVLRATTGAKFKDTTLTSLPAFGAELKRLNIIDDRTVADVSTWCEATPLDPATLRSDRLYVRNLATQITQLLEKCQ